MISYLESGDVEGAKEFLKKELAEIEKMQKIPFCENTLINAVLSEYRTKAEQKDWNFLHGYRCQRNLPVTKRNSV